MHHQYFSRVKQFKSDLVPTHTASFDLSSADNLGRCVLTFHRRLFSLSLEIMFYHKIYCFSFTNIHLQVFFKAKNKDSCAKSKSKCFNTTCVTHLNIARMFTDYLPRFFAMIFQFSISFRFRRTSDSEI